MCSLKWDEPTLIYKNIANPLEECLQQCGLKVNQIGNTYMADQVLKNWMVPESALDHIYVSESFNDKVEAMKLSNSSTDNVLAEYKQNNFKTVRYE